MDNHKIINNLSHYIQELKQYTSENFVFRGENGYFENRRASTFRNGFEHSYFEPILDEYYSQVAHRISDVEKEHFVAFAQHHGLPTNLIDITSAPLVALFNACYGVNNIGYVYIFNKKYHMDITDVISMSARENILDSFREGNKKIIQKLYEAISNFCTKFNLADYPITIDLMSKLCDIVVENWVKDYDNNAEVRCGTQINGKISNKELKEKKNSRGYEITVKKVVRDAKCFNSFPELMLNNNFKLADFLYLLFYGCCKNSNQCVDFFPTMIYKPKITFERARIQQGYFIYQLYSNLNDGEWKPQTIKHDYVVQVENPKEILCELDNIGINYGTLYGDFDSIAKYIKEKRFPKADNTEDIPNE